MMSWVKSNEDQIKLWKESEVSRYEGHIQLYENLNVFILTNCRLLLFECDIRVAATHLILSHDDWEFRFFCRRVFTLFHEMGPGFSNLAGREKNKLLEPYFGAEAMTTYAARKNKLDKFLGKNDVLFKRVRNKCEAHKDCDVSEQIRTIESLSVNDSWLMINEGLHCLFELSVEVGNVLRLFSKRNNRH